MHESTDRPTAWDQLARELRGFVGRRVPEPADADDIVQETLLRMHRGVATLQDDARVGAWMTRIARNAIADHHRDRAARARRSEGAALDPTVARPQEPALGADDDAAALLTACIGPFVDALPAPYAEALRLTELQGMTQRQAATRAGVSLSGMKSRVQRGRALLRADLEQCCAIELDARGRVVGAVPRTCGDASC